MKTIQNHLAVVLEKRADSKKLLNSIFSPNSKILNPKNKNHWIAMVRGIAVNHYNWNKEDAKSVFKSNTLIDYYKKGYTPLQFMKETESTWNV